jgi:hypothetical protein
MKQIADGIQAHIVSLENQVRSLQQEVQVTSDFFFFFAHDIPFSDVATIRKFMSL